MIGFEEALEIVTSPDYEVGHEKVDILDSMNRVLAEDIRSDMDMPPFDKSAVDGYALRIADIGKELEVVEVIPAGKMPTKKIELGQCAKIMTGAPMPEGADGVIMVEDVEETGEKTIRYRRDKVKDNVCYLGEDIKKDEVVLTKGTLIQPQHIAVMATAGFTNPRVYRKVRVAVISTGDELVEPYQKPEPSQIRNSNAYQLVAQVHKFGGVPDYIGIASDTEVDTHRKISRALDGNDVVLLTGGVSTGDFDHVPKVLKELGVEIKFKSIAVQPGRPTVFGMKNRQFLFGLPGNPVSSFVQFELLVKPLLYKLTGFVYQPVTWRLPMGEDYSRRKSGRLSWLPIRINDRGEVIPIDYHGSAHINALTMAQGIISIAIGKTEIKKGEFVNVRQI
ncbi:MAG: molybdopterin molybdotransferase MoeA [Bacteroidetes bacterium]|nr:molybdopterin molybdotransferase MoeA [Bacteroidota bacterium]